MDHKRKASGNRASPDAEERAAKRQKGAQDGEFDISQGETRESTTHYGLIFLQQVRKTQDKHGRPIAPNFEDLPDRESNQDYYHKIRMPISLQTIETKLRNGEFFTLTELESYTKRMVTNFKEYYHKDSSMWHDAEKIRKAISNHMKNLNPAYGDRNYTARATSLPPDEALEEPEPQATTQPSQPATDDGGDVDAEGDEEDDADGDKDEEEDEDEDNEDPEPIFIPKRRGPGRPPKNPALHAKKMAAKAAMQARADNQFEGVPYKGLSFQQAQEKMVEELIRKKDPEDESYRHFEVFVDLPPKSLKDYYKVITEPMALRKLQTMVRGVANRHDSAGTSEFKSWAAFEETTGLLWQNAKYYNEEGSEIYMQAEEMEAFFKDQLSQAKEVVQEPPQPAKIKLKVNAAEPPAAHKKITIHVGGRVGSVDSPAPLTARSAGSQSDSHAPLSNPILERTRSVSAASPSPSLVNGKGEESSRLPSAQPHTANGTPAVANAQLAGPLSNGVIPIPAKQREPVWKSQYRQPGKGLKDALITKAVLQTHPGSSVDKRIYLELLAHPTEARVASSFIVARNTQRVQIIVHYGDFLKEVNDRFKFFYFLIDNQLMAQGNLDPRHNPQVFETRLHPGDIEIKVDTIASIPESERKLDGPQFELERFTFLLRVENN